MRLKQSSWVWTVSKITILIKALWRNLQIFHANLMANFHTCAATPYNIQRPRARRGSKQKEKRKYFYDLFTRTTVYFSATIIYRRPSTYYCCVHCFFFRSLFFWPFKFPRVRSHNFTGSEPHIHFSWKRDSRCFNPSTGPAANCVP